MLFTDQEMAAILNLASTMALADGKMDKIEGQAIARELIRFGCDESKSKRLINESKLMEQIDACTIISRMTPQEKRYVTAFLIAIMVADGIITVEESRILSIITAICNLPQVTIKEALETMLK